MSFHRPLMLALVVASASISGVAAAAPSFDTHAEVGQHRRVVVRSRPPAVVRERVTVRPSARHVWVGGHWGWHDRWVWAPGRWVIPPQPAAVWVPGHWDETPEGFVWEPGHWA